MSLPPPYRLVDGPPGVEHYLRLRAEAGLTPRSRAQAEAALLGSWDAVHVVDMAVLPEHQRRGIGDAVLDRLLSRIRTDAPPGAYVSLLADAPGRRLYERHGFVPTAPRSIGMAVPTSP